MQSSTSLSQSDEELKHEEPTNLITQRNVPDNYESRKGDELNDLISALKAQSSNTVKGSNKNNGKFTSLLNQVLNTDDSISSTVVNSNIKPQTAIFNGLDIGDPFCSLVNSVADYIKELIIAKNEFIENNNSSSQVKTSHLESISALISDLSHRKSSDSNISADDKTIQQQNSDPNDFTLTEQRESEELSIDEQLRQAQLAAIALDEQQKELNEKLKAEAKLLNEKINASEIINEAEQSLNEFKKTDSEQFVSSDEGLIEFDSSENDENNESKDIDNNSEKTTVSNSYSIIEVSDMFSENSEKKTVLFSKDIPDLYSVLSLVNSNISKKDNASVCIKKDYSSGLVKAVEDSLLGKLGSNKNIAIKGSANLQVEQSAKIITQQNIMQSQSEQDIYHGDDALNIDDSDIEYEEKESDPDLSNTTNSKELIVDLNLQSTESHNNIMLADGNPMNLKASTLALIEQDQNYENRALGRKLETKDFYPALLNEDDWYKDIINAGYNSGPTYSALCYSNRIKNDEYDWTIQMSSDMSLLMQAPDFHHNLRTKFSIYIGHPLELKLEAYNGVPPNCPEDKARHCYLNTIDLERKKMISNSKLKLFVEHLGDDLSTVNLGLYTQLDSPDK